jgi:hypothetical protein
LQARASQAGRREQKATESNIHEKGYRLISHLSVHARMTAYAHVARDRRWFTLRPASGLLCR